MEWPKFIGKSFNGSKGNDMIAESPFKNTDICVDRLYKEYESHPRLIIACDWDDTLFNFHNRKQMHNDIISILQECNRLNFYVVLFTASQKERHAEILENAAKMGLKIDSINKNPIELPYGNEGKIYFNILLDDRAGLGQSSEILRKTLDKIYWSFQDC
jgi:hypothetical protein